MCMSLNLLHLDLNTINPTEITIIGQIIIKEVSFILFMFSEAKAIDINSISTIFSAVWFRFGL